MSAIDNPPTKNSGAKVCFTHRHTRSSSTRHSECFWRCAVSCCRQGEGTSQGYLPTKVGGVSENPRGRRGNGLPWVLGNSSAGRHRSAGSRPWCVRWIGPPWKRIGRLRVWILRLDIVKVAIAINTSISRSILLPQFLQITPTSPSLSKTGVNNKPPPPKDHTSRPQAYSKKNSTTR